MVVVTFNAVELTQWLTVTSNFTAFGGADFDPHFNDYTIVDGSEFSYMRKKRKEISIPFYIKYRSFADYDALQKALNVSEPKELTFSILPNRVFYAVPSGDLDFDEIRLNGKGTLTFIIADGLAHSKVPTEFAFAKNEQGVWETTIINNGSESVAINYDIQLKKESGFIEIASLYGGMQFGKREEIDGVMAEKSVTLVKTGGTNFNNWTDGTVFYENQDKKAVTTMGATSDYGGWLGTLPTYSNTKNGGQFGAIKEIALSETATNWYIWARAWFETGLMGQTGAWCLSVIDENNHFIAGMAIEKSDTVGNRAQVRFLIGDGQGGSEVKETIDFTPSYWVSDNPYGSEGRTTNRNMFDLKKEGEKVTYFWYGSYHPYFSSGIKTAKAAKIQFFAGQYKGRNTTDRLVNHHYLSDLSFIKLNVPYWKDVPNRYPTGATLKIVGAEGKLYVNGKVTEKDEILGTDYFKAPPGKTKVQLVTSSFGEIASAKATIEEAYT